MSYADTPKVPQRWLAWPFVAQDVMTLGAGKGGIAKGRVACSLIGDVTTGRAFFGGLIRNPFGPMDVVAWTPEDRPDTAMTWRLDAALANRRRVHDVTYRPDGSKRVLDDEGLTRIAAECAKIRKLGRTVGLIYIDPLAAVLPEGKSIASNPGARANVVDPLDELAKRERCAVLLNAHTVKDGSIQGSQGLVDASRLVLLYKRGKLGVCTMDVYKSNIGPDSESVDEEGRKLVPPMQYHLIGTDDEDMRIEWLGQLGNVSRETTALRAVRCEPQLTGFAAEVAGIRQQYPTKGAALFAELRSQAGGR